MALSDILGGSTQKSVFRQSPDAFILINQYNYINNAQTGLAVHFNDDIKSINVQGSIDSPPAKATVSFAVNRSDTQYFAFGRPVFYPMMEIQIFIKGRYNTLLEDGVTITPPPAYQQFHGVITSVSDDYTGGEHSITIQCEDLIYFLKIIKMGSHPSVLYSQTTGVNNTVHASVFETDNVKNIIRKLCNFAYGGQIGTPGSEGSRNANAIFTPESVGTSAFISAGASTPFGMVPPGEFIDSQQRVMSDYWAQRFGIIAGDGSLSQEDSNVLQLLIYAFSAPITVPDTTDPTNTNQGANTKDITYSDDTPASGISQTIDGNAIRGQNANAAPTPGSVSASTGNIGITNSSAASTIDYLIDKSAPFGELSSINTFNTEYSTLLDIAIVCRDYVGYEFYMSLDGNIIFKPPFYNMDVSQYQPFVIKDSDILSWAFNETDDVITYMSVRGNISQTVKDLPKYIVETGNAADFRLAKQFLQRQQSTDMQMAAALTENSTGITQAPFLAIYAQNLMDIHNAKRFNGTITIPGTPEIKLGYPVYIAPRDCFAYVTNINHSFSFGNAYTTTLELTAFRYQNFSGPNVVSAPGAPATALNGSFLDPEMELREASGNVVGSGGGANLTRTETPNGTIDQTNSFYLNRTQRISDARGYEIVGTIGYAVDTMLDVSGNLVIQPTSLAADPTLGNTTQAAQFASVDVSPSPSTVINSVAPPPGPPVAKPTAAQVNSVDVANPNGVGGSNFLNNKLNTPLGSGLSR